MLLRLNDWIARALLTIAAVLAFLLSFVVCADVLGRDLLGRPIQGTKELVEITIVIILWLQAAYAIRSGGMIWVDALHVHLPARAQRGCEVFGALLGIAFFALICWGSIDPALYSWQSNEFEGEGALRVPVWPARFLVMLGSFLAAFNYLLLAIERMRAFASGRPPPPPASEIKLEERIA